MQIIVDNLAITYEISGNGKTVLMLHGWGDDHNTYRALSEKLTNNFKLVALDLPGFGLSQSPPKAWNLDDYAALVADFLVKLRLTPYAIIGHSNGGALAIRGLSRGKLKADKLVLIASAGIRNTHKAKKALIKSVAKTGKVATVWLPRSTRAKLQRKLYGSVGSDLFLKPELKETFALTVRQDIQDDAAKLNLPVMLINADRDPAVPLSYGERLHALIDGSTLEVISDNDHFVHQRQSEKLATLILGFL